MFRRFKTDIFRADVGIAFAGGAGADKADVGVAALVRAVTKIFAGLIACLLLLSSGASATTFSAATVTSMAGDKTAARAQNWAGVGAVASANTTSKCGVGTKTRIKPLILVVASGITWQDLQSEDSDTKNYLMGYPATPMNLVVRGHKDGTNFDEQLAMLFSGRRDKFTRKYRNSDIINSPLAKTLNAAGCTFAVDSALPDRKYYADGRPEQLSRPDLADVTVVKATYDKADKVVSKLRRLKTCYGSSVDIMTISITTENGISDDDRLYLALIPSLRDANAAGEKVRVPSTHQNNLVQLIDIPTTIAARYGAKSPEGASGQALMQNPQTINKPVFVGECVDSLGQDSSNNPATTKVSSARQDLINSLINQNNHAHASRAVMVYNTIIIVVFTLAVVWLWWRKC